MQQLQLVSFFSTESGRLASFREIRYLACRTKAREEVLASFGNG